MSEKKVYQIGCNTEAGWDIVHELLTRDGTLEDNIPSRSVELVDYKEHDHHYENDAKSIKFDENPELSN
jgi:hypothetical protein